MMDRKANAGGHMRASLPAVVSAALLLAAATPAVGAPAPAKPSDVNVVNTATSPVPIFSAQPLTIQGVGGAPVETAISGTPTVQISGTTTVQPQPAYYRVVGNLSAS